METVAVHDSEHENAPEEEYLALQQCAPAFEVVLLAKVTGLQKQQVVRPEDASKAEYMHQQEALSEATASPTRLNGQYVEDKSCEVQCMVDQEQLHHCFELWLQVSVNIRQVFEVVAVGVGLYC